MLHKKKFDKKWIFYIILVGLPLIQYAIFYLYVNMNSFVLAFTSYDKISGEQTFAGLDNFRRVYDMFFNSEYSHLFAIRFQNAMVDYLLKLVVGTGGAVVFSYYIYKKQFGSGFFKIVLFLPQVIPGIALISIYRYVVETGVVSIYNEISSGSIASLLNNADTVYGVVLFFSLFLGFGTQVLMYLGAMNKINPSITEASMLDGVTFTSEFFLITLPCVFSTIATFFVVGLTGIFTNDLGMYSFFASNAPGEAQTIGYYLFNITKINATNQSEWPYIAAVGICFTVVLAPISIFLKWWLDKKDPMN